MTKQVYGAKDIQEILDVSESKAYQYIRQMNGELQAKGYLITRGRVPVSYFEKRFFGMSGTAPEAPEDEA